MIALFIGGHADGQRIEVSGTSEYIEVAQHGISYQSPTYTGAGASKVVLGKTQIYRRDDYNFDGQNFIVYVLDTLTPVAAFAELLKKYPKSEA